MSKVQEVEALLSADDREQSDSKDVQQLAQLLDALTGDMIEQFAGDLRRAATKAADWLHAHHQKCKPVSSAGTP